MSDEATVRQILIYEVDAISGQQTGFIMQANDKEHVKELLEAESFTTKFYKLNIYGQEVDIRSNKMLESFYNNY